MCLRARRMNRRDVPDLGNAAANYTPHDDRVYFDRLAFQYHPNLTVRNDQFISEGGDGDRLDLKGAIS